MWTLRALGIRWPLIAASIVFARPAAAQQAATVTLERVPGGGLQPQVALAADGTLHLLYFRGDPAHGDLYYVQRGAGAKEFSTAIRVNSQPGSAVAVGNMRGGQIALGRNGLVHVAWNGSDRAQNGPARKSEARPAHTHDASPMLYARLCADRKSFEPQRNLMTQTYSLDGGGTLAAGADGTVLVVWHANRVGEEQSESNRRVYVARSSDDGSTFSAETAVADMPPGCCACCGMRAIIDSSGGANIFFRSAIEHVNRDMTVLSAKGPGDAFVATTIDRWRLDACPASSAGIATLGSNVLLAWESQNQVRFARFDPITRKASQPVSAPESGPQRKYPSVTGNSRGQVLLVWAEDMSWGQPGTVHWQVFDANDRPIPGSAGKTAGLPAWSTPAAFTRPDGCFTILY